jgi:hypothetical protein
MLPFIIGIYTSNHKTDPYGPNSETYIFQNYGSRDLDALSGLKKC